MCGVGYVCALKFGGRTRQSSGLTSGSAPTRLEDTMGLPLTHCRPNALPSELCEPPNPKPKAQHLFFLNVSLGSRWAVPLCGQGRVRTAGDARHLRFQDPNLDPDMGVFHSHFYLQIWSPKKLGPAVEGVSTGPFSGWGLPNL